MWEREVRSVKSALHACVGAQPVHEEVLLTVLLEVEAILNSKPLGYVSADIADIDPITPNSLLMGRPDGSLPQVSRQKRHSSLPELQNQAIVMLMDPQLPRALWPIGRVVKVHHSDDGYIRSADVSIKG
ncbi:hypothetical protein AOLI_G00125720 [Acnodon oligacanthus]